MTALWSAVGSGAPPPSVDADSGFSLTPTTLAGAPALAVVETATHRRGGGVYVVRTGALPRERIVQVPHSFFDEETLPIGLALAEAGAARALFVNTVHRYQAGRPRAAGPDESKADAASPSDLAHQRRSFFQEMTEAALAKLRGVAIIQVHGFKPGTSRARARAEVVVSAGAAHAGDDEAARVAARLAALLGDERVLLYPRDTTMLGAMTNAQGEVVARHPPATFLHLELSRALRDRLASDGELRTRFARAVFGASTER